MLPVAVAFHSTQSRIPAPLLWRVTKCALSDRCQTPQNVICRFLVGTNMYMFAIMLQEFKCVSWKTLLPGKIKSVSCSGNWPCSLNSLLYEHTTSQITPLSNACLGIVSKCIKHIIKDTEINVFCPVFCEKMQVSVTTQKMNVRGLFFWLEF